MMINKRLIGTVSESKRYVAGNAAFQWCSLAASGKIFRLLDLPEPAQGAQAVPADCAG